VCIPKQARCHERKKSAPCGFFPRRGWPVHKKSTTCADLDILRTEQKNVQSVTFPDSHRIWICHGHGPWSLVFWSSVPGPSVLDISRFSSNLDMSWTWSLVFGFLVLGPWSLRPSHFQILIESGYVMDIVFGPMHARTAAPLK